VHPIPATSRSGRSNQLSVVFDDDARPGSRLYNEQQRPIKRLSLTFSSCTLSHSRNLTSVRFYTTSPYNFGVHLDSNGGRRFEGPSHNLSW
jgi:hypothetical protein